MQMEGFNMAMIKCAECGKDISDKADKCPNCGCPVSYSIENTEDVKSEKREPSTEEMVTNNVKDNKKKEKKKDSTLSVWAAVLGFISFTTYLGGLLGIIDLIKNRRDGKRHLGSYFAIVMCILWIVVGGSDGGTPTKEVDNKQVNILIVEDENISIYLDHIENGKIYIKYENHSDDNINVQYSDLTINGERYYQGFFVNEVYSNDDLVKKLSLYDKDGKTSNYNYNSGTIKGKFEYFKGGIGFTTELEFDEIEF